MCSTQEYKSGCTRFDEYFAINRNICTCTLNIQTHKMSNVCLFVFSVYSLGLVFLFYFIQWVCAAAIAFVIAQSSYTTMRLEIFHRWLYQIFNVFVWFLSFCWFLCCTYMQIWSHTHTHIIMSSAHECMHAWRSMNFMSVCARKYK